MYGSERRGQVKKEEEIRKTQRQGFRIRKVRNRGVGINLYLKRERPTVKEKIKKTREANKHGLGDKTGQISPQPENRYPGTGKKRGCDMSHKQVIHSSYQFHEET